MSVLCLPGWQQPTDALANIAPDALHFDYAAYDNVNEMLAALPPSPRLAIGWSLGGQLLARAISAGHTKPETLLLLGAPYQCVADAHFPSGMPPAMLDDFIENYTKAPAATLKQFNTLLALGDAHEKTILKTLNASVQVQPNGLFWLQELQKTTCKTLNFSRFPKTIIVHGVRDKVIDVSNAAAWQTHIQGAEIKLWPDCAHAPHLHNPHSLKEMIQEYVR